MSNPYREFIYRNDINDYGLADVGYNLFAVALLMLLSWIKRSSLTKNELFDVILFYLGYLLYELLSYWFPVFGTFDFKDIIALTVSFLISLILLFKYRPKFNERKHIHKSIS